MGRRGVRIGDGLLYVNSNEQPWIIRMVTLYTLRFITTIALACTARTVKVSLVSFAGRYRAARFARRIRVSSRGTGRMPASVIRPRDHEIVDFSADGKDTA